MRAVGMAGLLVGVMVSVGQPVRGQTPNPLVGAWERFALKDSTGMDIQPPSPAAFVIFSADGFYSQSGIPAGRPRLTKPLADYTKEELIARFDRTEARRGRYTISGNTLTRTYVTSLNPNAEGGPAQVQRFRIEGDVLILSSTSPTSKGEARFRRAK